MTSISYTVSDALAMTRRNLIRYVRIPTLLVFSTVQPVMFVLLFTYVFGGAVKGVLPQGEKYIEFLMPGIFVQTVIFGSTQTGVGLAEDLSKGMIERFRSLPMARSAVLAGRTVADLSRSALALAVMVGLGVLVGFRFHNTLPANVAGIALILGFGYSFSWMYAAIGLAVKDPETAQSAGILPFFILVFASSAIVPVSSGSSPKYSKFRPPCGTRARLIPGPSSTWSARLRDSMPMTSPNCVATARSNEAATAMPEGNAVALAELVLIIAAKGSPGVAVGTQSFCPTPTGPFVTRSVGMWRRTMPGTCRPP